MTIPEITDHFERMTVSKQPATNRGKKLRLGTFANRTAELFKLRAVQYAKIDHVDFSLSYTLLAYLDCMGINVTTKEAEFIRANMGSVVKAYHQRNQKLAA